MANTNCAASLMAALLNDGEGKIVTEAEATAGAANPEDTNIYLCIDMGDTGVICIKRPKQGEAIRVRI